MYILDSLDKLILQNLKTKAMTASSLSIIIEKPRTTILFRLKRLESTNYVTSSTAVGKKVLWEISLKKNHNKEYFAYFDGISFFECYKSLFSLKRNSVIYVVQGVGAGKAEFENIPHNLIEEMHLLYKRRGIIMYGVTNPNLLKIFQKLNRSLRESHKGRSQGIRVHDRLFNSTGELFVTKNFVIVVDPKMRRGVVIKEPGVVSLFYDFMILFHTFSDQLTYLDINAHIKNDLTL